MAVSTVERSPWLLDSPGAVLKLFREDRTPLTKADVMQRTGLSRTAVNKRLDLLLHAGILETADGEARTGGRPADRFQLNARRGVVLIADTGATGMRVAICDLRADVLREVYEVIDTTDGPESVLGEVARVFGLLLSETGWSRDQVAGIGIDVPGPVDHATGRVVSPPIMTGWHDYDIPAFFAADYSCPVIVEKDANAMAFGEHRLVYPTADNLVFVKFGTGLGTGMVINREIYRGSSGAAGDIGHIPLTMREDDDAPMCRCGNIGCVEAYASGWALARDLRELGHSIDTVNDVADSIRARNTDAIRLVRAASTVIGRALSDLVNIVNPQIIAIGGQLVTPDDLLLAGVREIVYSRSLPLATRSLQIVRSELDERAGVHGLARLALDEAYSVERINVLVEG